MIEGSLFNEEVFNSLLDAFPELKEAVENPMDDTDDEWEELWDDEENEDEEDDEDDE